MKYSVPHNKQEWQTLCADAGVNMPYSEATDVLASPLSVGGKIAPTVVRIRQWRDVTALTAALPIR